MKKILVALNPHIKATKEFLVGVSAFAHSHKGWILHLDDEPKSLTEETLKEYAQNGISSKVSVAKVYSFFKGICETGKRSRDYLGNNINHPNDFGVRIYAQVVLKTLCGEEFFPMR